MLELALEWTSVFITVTTAITIIDITITGTGTLIDTNAGISG